MRNDKSIRTRKGSRQASGRGGEGSWRPGTNLRRSRVVRPESRQHHRVSALADYFDAAFWCPYNYAHPLAVARKAQHVKHLRLRRHGREKRNTKEKGQESLSVGTLLSLLNAMTENTPRVAGTGLDHDVEAPGLHTAGAD